MHCWNQTRLISSTSKFNQIPLHQRADSLTFNDKASAEGQPRRRYYALRSSPGSNPTPQLRVYGMKYFDDKVSYWGNATNKIIGAGGDRFTLRSAKFVMDGS